MNHLGVKSGAAAAHEVGDCLVKELGHIHIERAQLDTRETGEGLHKSIMEDGNWVVDVDGSTCSKLALTGWVYNSIQCILAVPVRHIIA